MMGRTNLVLQKKDLAEMEENLNGIRQYEFFDSQNEEEARDLSEAVLHAVYNQSPRQAVIQARELKLIWDYDRSLKAIELLRGRAGDSVKVFCVHSGVEGNFKVRGRDFDWEVKELSESDERIPAEFIKNITYLRFKGLKIDGISIATPLEHRSIKEIIKEEFSKAATGLVSVLRGIMVLPLILLRGLLEDPILLIRFGKPNISGSIYVEAGRWV